MYISGVHIHGLYVWYDTYTSAYVCSCAHALHNLFIDRRAHCTDMCAQRWLHQALLAPLTSSDKVDVCLWISGHHPYTLKQLKCARIPHPYSYKSLCLNLLLWSHIAFLGVWNSTETHQPSFETCVVTESTAEDLTFHIWNISNGSQLQCQQGQFSCAVS